VDRHAHRRLPLTPGRHKDVFARQVSEALCQRAKGWSFCLSSQLAIDELGFLGEGDELFCSFRWIEASGGALLLIGSAVTCRGLGYQITCGAVRASSTLCGVNGLGAEQQRDDRCQ